MFVKMENVSLYNLRHYSTKIYDFIRFVTASCVILTIAIFNKLIMIFRGKSNKSTKNFIEKSQFVLRHRSYCREYIHYIYKLVQPADVLQCSARIYDDTRCTMLTDFRYCDEHHKQLKLHCAAYHMMNDYELLPKLPDSAVQFFKQEQSNGKRININDAIEKKVIPRGLYRHIARMAIVEDRLRNEHVFKFQLNRDAYHAEWQMGLYMLYKNYYDIDREGIITSIKREKKWESEKRMNQIKYNYYPKNKYENEYDSGEDTDEEGCGDVRDFTISEREIYKEHKMNPASSMDNSVWPMSIKLNRLSLHCEFELHSDTSNNTRAWIDWLTINPTNWMQRIVQKREEGFQHKNYAASYSEDTWGHW